MQFFDIKLRTLRCTHVLSDLKNVLPISLYPRKVHQKISNPKKASKFQTQKRPQHPSLSVIYLSTPLRERDSGERYLEEGNNMAQYRNQT